jgi:hypothetical protein
VSKSIEARQKEMRKEIDELLQPEKARPAAAMRGANYYPSHLVVLDLHVCRRHGRAQRGEIGREEEGTLAAAKAWQARREPSGLVWFVKGWGRRKRKD